MRGKKSLAAIHFIILFLCACFLIGGGVSSAGTGRTWAVIVGINKYQKDVTPLTCAVSDAMAFKDALMYDAGAKEDDIFLLTSDQTGNRSPDKSSIIRWISYAKQNAGPADSFIFFFSGHGIDMENESYLLTIEADPYSRETLEASSLKVSDIKRYLTEMKAGKILVFVDACRNDPRSGKGEHDNALSESFSKGLSIKGPETSQEREQTFATFFSCKVGQRSFEWNEKNMGFFTYYLVKGIGGDAKDRDGNVTLNSLESYLGKAVPEAVNRERGHRQNPWVFRAGASGMGEEKIATASQKITPRPTLTPKQTSTPSPQPTKSPEGTQTGRKPVIIPGYSSAEQAYSRLHWAVDNGQIDLIGYMIENDGVDVNGQDFLGRTPLHAAVTAGRKDMVELLISYKADVNSRDKQGKTPLKLARELGKKDIEAILLKYGATE